MCIGIVWAEFQRPLELLLRAWPVTFKVRLFGSQCGVRLGNEGDHKARGNPFAG
jgi:hypothetical protein